MSGNTGCCIPFPHNIHIETTNPVIPNQNWNDVAEFYIATFVLKQTEFAEQSKRESD